MDEKAKHNKYLIIHTHFYQPPRENPYTGEIDLDYTAKPYDNWNHRIAMECYFPNLYARIYDNQANIVEIINNCSYYNLNFGPTLISWIEKKYPHYYKRIIQTYNQNKNSLNNFIAQAYNHTILPLDSFFDKLIQITWGIKDFEHRFGSTPSGMWLGECAVNDDVLKILIDLKISYIILSPSQISKAFDPKTNSIKPVLPNMIYRWYDKTADGKIISSRFIDIVTYDDVLSKRVAFNNITFNSEIFSKELNNRYIELKTNTIIIAIDGETFGHHYKFADLTLAHAFKYELSKHGIIPISIYNYIKNHQLYAVCELNNGPDNIGTSWSCEHGIRRWFGGCPCGDEGKYSTEWRKGLRSAINWISEVINDIFIEEGKKIFNDYILAAKEYIDLINSKVSFDEYIQKHLITINGETRTKAIKLLEMFRYKLLSRTSCGWFFNDISRIETQYIMRYAMKACDIAEELGYKGIEKGFISMLETAPSNFNEFKNGKGVYEKIVKPIKIDEKKVLLYLALKTALLGREKYINSIYKINITNLNFSNNNSVAEINVEAEKIDGIKKVFFVKIDFTSIENIRFLIKDEISTEEFNIYNFTPIMQVEILKIILNIKKSQNIKDLEDILNSLIETAQIYPTMAYENLYEDINYFFKSITDIYLIMFIKESNISYVMKIKHFIEKLNKIGFQISFEPSNDIVMLMPDIVKKIFSDKFSLQEIKEIDNIFKKLSLHHFYFHTNNYLYDIKSRVKD